MRLGTLYENVTFWDGYTKDWIVHYAGVQNRPEGTQNENSGNDQRRGLIIQP